MYLRFHVWMHPLDAEYWPLAYKNCVVYIKMLQVSKNVLMARVCFFQTNIMQYVYRLFTKGFTFGCALYMQSNKLPICLKVSKGF